VSATSKVRGRDHLDQQRADRLVEARPWDALAGARTDSRAIAIAQIRGHLLSVGTYGVAHIHPIATASAQQKPLQQGGPFARWALSAIVPVRLGILEQSLLVGLVLLPRDVSCVRTPGPD